jgi:hypothetical protein
LFRLAIDPDPPPLTPDFRRLRNIRTMTWLAGYSFSGLTADTLYDALPGRLYAVCCLGIAWPTRRLALHVQEAV